MLALGSLGGSDPDPESHQGGRWENSRSWAVSSPESHWLPSRSDMCQAATVRRTARGCKGDMLSPEPDLTGVAPGLVCSTRTEGSRVKGSPPTPTLMYACVRNGHMCRALPGPDPIPKQEMACVAPLSWRRTLRHRKVNGLTQGHVAGASRGAGRGGVDGWSWVPGPPVACPGAACLVPAWSVSPGALNAQVQVQM